MHYAVRFRREGSHWLAEFPDAPGCQTYAASRDELWAAATEALEGWLCAHMAHGNLPPEPRDRRGRRIFVDPRIAIAVLIRRARCRYGHTQVGLAKLAGLTQQRVAKLEDPRCNPSLRTVTRAFAALGLDVDFSVWERDYKSLRRRVSSRRHG